MSPPVSRSGRVCAYERLEPRLALATVSGAVYLDANLNGQRDAGEPGLTGPSSTGPLIYDDVDDDGVYESSTETAAPVVAGTYQFPFPPASLEVNLRAQLPLGFALTTPLQPELASQEFPAGFGAVAAAAGRFDAGESLDLIVANAGTNTLSLYLNGGTGNFAAPMSVAVGSGPTALAVADFNRDGADDVAVAYANLSFVTVLRGNGAGGFTRIDVPVGVGPRSIVAADLNGDGYVDLATANSFSDTFSVRLNNKSPNVGFNAVTNFVAPNGPAHIDVGRFNADAAPDIAIVTADAAQIFLNNGAGAFTPGALIPVDSEFDPVAGAAAGDVDGDSFADLVILFVSGAGEIRRGSASGGLSPGPVLSFLGAFGGFDLIDVDHDKDLDAVAVGHVEESGIGALTIKRNNGGGLFEFSEVNIGSLALSVPIQIAAGDFNGDGVTDMAIAQQSPLLASGRLTVFFNQLAADKHQVHIVASSTTYPPEGRAFGLGPVVSAASRAGGDYNGNSIVNAADLAVWIANYGRTAGPGMAADGQQNHRVDGGDFLLWQRRSGSTIPAAMSALAATSVDERPLPRFHSALAQAWEQLSSDMGRGAIDSDSVASPPAQLPDDARFVQRLPTAVSSPTTAARRERLAPLNAPDRAVVASDEDRAAFDAALAEFDRL